MSSPRHADPSRRADGASGAAPLDVAPPRRSAARAARPAPHGHGHDHALAASVRTSPRTRAVVLAILLPVLVATVVGAVALWPSGDRLPAKISSAVPGAVLLHGTVTGPADDQGDVPVRVDRVGTPTPDPTGSGTGASDADSSADAGAGAAPGVPVTVGQHVEASAPPQLVQYGFTAGQRVIVLYLPTGDGGDGGDGGATAGDAPAQDDATAAGSADAADGSATDGSAPGGSDAGAVTASTSAFGIVDFDRTFPVGLLALTFAVLVVVVARWRGLAALAGLGVALVTVGFFTVPALLEGRDALGVGLVTAVAVMFVTLYLAHGFTVRTSTALLGTLAGVAVAGGLAWWASGAAQITGATSEESYWLPGQAPHVSLAGVALCGMILAGLGALNDVTITQASAVWELRAVAPDAGRRELFTSALRIGRDHIASTVYTIAFAYLGASLPLLLAVWLQDQPLSLSLTTGSIVEELARTLVGTIGLVLAIPLTTAIAAVCVPAARVELPSAMDPAETLVVGAGPEEDFWADRRPGA